jgi:S-DNA-T family DNA segregation ATPase FtsK/SpoIIIE
MAKKPSSKKKQQGNRTSQVVWGLICILVALIVAGGMAGGAGIGGSLIAQGAYALLGAGAIMIPLALGTAGIYIIRNKRFEATTREIVSGSIGMLSLLVLLSVISTSWGGFVGRLFALPLTLAFDTLFATIILSFVVLCSFCIFFDRTPQLFPFFGKLWDRIRGVRIAGTTEEDGDTDEYVVPASSLADDKDEVPVPAKAVAQTMKVTDASAADELSIDAKKRPITFGAYTPPPLDLLEGDRGKANVGDVKANANIIRRTLGNFGIEVEMDEVTIGPTVTRYALKPAQGVKLSRIVGLQNDLALSLAAHPLRIEAPIPGKSLVGIEIPNKTKAPCTD